MSRKEDEQLPSLRWADESRTRAPVPMNLPRQFSLQSDDEAARSGGGDMSFLLGSPSVGHRGGESRDGDFPRPFA